MAFSIGFIAWLHAISISQEIADITVKDIPVAIPQNGYAPSIAPKIKMIEKTSMVIYSLQTRLVKTSGFLCFFLSIVIPFIINVREAIEMVTVEGKGVKSSNSTPTSTIRDIEA